MTPLKHQLKADSDKAMEFVKAPAALHEALGESLFPDGYYYRGEKRIDVPERSELRDLRVTDRVVTDTPELDECIAHSRAIMGEERWLQLNEEWSELKAEEE